MARINQSRKAAGWTVGNPLNQFAMGIRRALAGWEPPPCRTLADMSEAEIVALEKHYGCPVRRPAK